MHVEGNAYVLGAKAGDGSCKWPCPSGCKQNPGDNWSEHKQSLRALPDVECVSGFGLGSGSGRRWGTWTCTSQRSDHSLIMPAFLRLLLMVDRRSFALFVRMPDD